jgi:hypothetical protein
MGTIQKNEKHKIEYHDFDIQLNQGGQSADRLSKTHRPGVEVGFFDARSSVAHL